MITASVIADETLDSAALKSYLWTNNFPALPRTPERQRPMTDINAFIDEKVKSNDVFLFMKGSPDFPQCGFSGQVVQILNYLGLDYGSANVLESAELRDGIKAYTNWPTIPQLYVKGEFVGGADIVREMFQAGELQSHLEAAGIPVKQTA
ncbi:monothiol glutaredoxin [Devosia sp. UYZn731]